MNIRICSMDTWKLAAKAALYTVAMLFLFCFFEDAGHAQESVCKKFTELQRHPQEILQRWKVHITK